MNRFRTKRRALLALLLTCLFLLPACTAAPAKSVTVVTASPVPTETPAPTQEPLPYADIDRDVTEAEINARGEVSALRRITVDAALSIVHEVHYFWGGKSEAIGKDPMWGTMRMVAAEGSDTSLTFRPLGLDCSGYVSWAMSQSGLTFDEMKRLVGNGTENQWKRSRSVTWATLKVGDLVFQYKPDDGLGNHVGIVVGFDERDEPLIAHCAGSFNMVVVTGRGSIFQYPRRPIFYGD